MLVKGFSPSAHTRLFCGDLKMEVPARALCSAGKRGSKSAMREGIW